MKSFPFDDKIKIDKVNCIKQALSDPLYLEDIEETREDFAAVDFETISNI